MHLIELRSTPAGPPGLPGRGPADAHADRREGGPSRRGRGHAVRRPLAGAPAGAAGIRASGRGPPPLPLTGAARYGRWDPSHRRRQVRDPCHIAYWGRYRYPDRPTDPMEARPDLRPPSPPTPVGAAVCLSSGRAWPTLEGIRWLTTKPTRSSTPKRSARTSRRNPKNSRMSSSPTTKTSPMTISRLTTTTPSSSERTRAAAQAEGEGQGRRPSGFRRRRRRRGRRGGRPRRRRGRPRHHPEGPHRRPARRGRGRRGRAARARRTGRRHRPHPAQAAGRVRLPVLLPGQAPEPAGRPRRHAVLRLRLTGP